MDTGGPSIIDRYSDMKTILQGKTSGIVHADGGCTLRKAVVVGLLVASYGTLVRADDKSATDAAYCIGVYQHDIEISKKGGGTGSTAAHMDRRDLELRKFRREEELQLAIKQKIIEYDIAAKITEDGYADSKIFTQIEKCVTEECKLPLQPACERIRKRCDPNSEMGQLGPQRQQP